MELKIDYIRDNAVIATEHFTGTVDEAAVKASNRLSEVGGQQARILDATTQKELKALARH